MHHKGQIKTVPALYTFPIPEVRPPDLTILSDMCYISGELIYKESKGNMPDKVKSLTVGKVSKEVEAIFRVNADVGMENVAGMRLPQLKITESNSKNEGEDGQYVPEGNFFYSPTQKDYEKLTVSIMRISRSFYTLREPTEKNPDPKPRFNQLVGGILLDTNEAFVMFAGGTRLQNLWDFGKKIRPLTKGKPPIPMFAIQTELTLEKIETSEGWNHIVIYSPVKNKAGEIVPISDKKKVNMILASMPKLQEMFDGFIRANAIDKTTRERIGDQLVPRQAPTDAEMLEEPTSENEGEDVVDTDDIPF